MLKDGIVLFGASGCNDAFSPWCGNDCALGVVVVMNILFDKFMKIKREREGGGERGGRGADCICG